MPSTTKQTIHTSTLDFNNLKTSMKNYLAGQTEFADFDFDGSGLSVLMDLLAYNSHKNALLANFGLNESFLSTAQTRSSMINHALNLGYVPRSKTGAKATVNLSVNLASVSPKPSTITLPQFSSFTSVVDGVSYTFYTLDEYIGYDRTGTGIYTFEVKSGDKDISISEGVLKTRNFRCADAQERQVYVIPDKNLDLSTLVVTVFDSISSTEFEIYERSSDIKEYNDDTKLFLPVETYNGFYEISFSDGQSTGTAPVPGNIIRAQYLAASGVAANTANVFTPTNQIEVNAQSYPLIVTTVSRAAFGAEKESIESIRNNAPLNLLTGSRLVTSSDYRTIIQSRVPGIKSVNAWGGEDNVPAKYGKVMVSLIFEDDVETTQKTLIQNTIRDDITDNLSVISVGMEFVDPTFTYVNVTTDIRYDESLTNRTPQSLENVVKSRISEFFTNNLGKFNDVFRKSKLTTVIDDADPAILSSDVTIQLESRFTPIVNTNTSQIVSADYEISYTNELAEPNSTTAVITSDFFTFNGTLCNISNKLDSTKLRILTQAGNIAQDNVGEYIPSTGKVNLVGFKPTSIASGNAYLLLEAVPKNGSVVKPLRNNVVTIGSNLVTATADINLANSVVGTTN